MSSRQREWQLRQKALGNCTQCGKPRGKAETRDIAWTAMRKLSRQEKLLGDAIARKIKSV